MNIGFRCDNFLVLLSTDTELQKSELIEKMACSNDPKEISSLMVMVLSTAKSSQEQQKLFLELTRRVEDRKLQLVEESQPVTSGVGGVEENEKFNGSGVSSSEVSARKSLLESAELKTLSRNVLPDVSGVEETVSSSSLLLSDASVPSSLRASNIHPSLTSSAASQGSYVPSATDGSLLSTIFSASSSAAPLIVKDSDNSARRHFSSSQAPQLTRTPTDPGFVVEQNLSNQQQNVSDLDFSVGTTLPGYSISGNSTLVFNSRLDSGDSKTSEMVSQALLFPSTLLCPQSSELSQGSANSEPNTANAVELPDALKALMNDVMGNAQFSSLEKRRKMLLKKEGKKAELSTKENLKEAESKKEREDEVKVDESESRDEEDKVNREVMKKPESTSFISDSSVALKLGNKDDNLDDNANKESGVVHPSIEELLDKLKKGGFQFPLPKTETLGVPSSSSSTLFSTTSEKNVDVSSNIPSADVLLYSAITTTSSSASAEATKPTDLLSSSSELDTDFRQQSKLPSLAVSSGESVTVPDVINSLKVDPRLSDNRDLTTRSISPFIDRDDKVCVPERERNQFRPLAPKHPLDPYAFPPLPGDPHVYNPPLPRSSLPLPHSPLHPRFPLPPTSAPVSAWPKPTTQPPPLPTEPDKYPETTMDNFPVSDVDYRTRNPTLAFLDDNTPPLQPPPLPSLPPLPGHHSQYPRSSSLDTDNARDYYQSARDSERQNSRNDNPASRDVDNHSYRDRSRGYLDRDGNRDYPDRDRNRDYSDRDRNRDYSDRDRNRDYPDRDYRSGRSYRNQNSRGSDNYKSRDDRRYYHKR
jgi:hypothetical protein